MKDYYQILEVSRNASSAEIKSNYKKLARKYHPDNRETGNEELFKELSTAYEVLSNPEKKSLYDQMGHEAFQKGGRGGSYSHSGDLDFEDLFESFFEGAGFSSSSRRGNRGNRPRQGDSIQFVKEIEFLDACFGKTEKIKIKKHISCNICNGTGADPEHKPSTCSTCNGRGEIKRTTKTFIGMITQVNTCPTCHGQGTVITHKCKNCSGKGFVEKEEEIEIKIPAGIEDGMQILYKGRGNEGLNHGPAGDLYILIRVKNHAKFKRKGLDIYEDINLNLWQAITGDEIEIETIHGKKKVKIETGTQSSSVLTLKGQGIKIDTFRGGNHYLNIKVIIPKKNQLSKELLEQIEKESKK